ncbi:hypothetical protein [Nonomuraea sp. NPDC002799]
MILVCRDLRLVHGGRGLLAVSGAHPVSDAGGDGITPVDTTLAAPSQRVITIDAQVPEMAAVVCNRI